jgi:hypothetical protein
MFENLSDKLQRVEILAAALQNGKMSESAGTKGKAVPWKDNSSFVTTFYCILANMILSRLEIFRPARS